MFPSRSTRPAGLGDRLSGVCAPSLLVTAGHVASAEPGWDRVIDLAELIATVRRDGLLRHLMRHRTVELRVPRLEAVNRPLLTGLLLRLLSRGDSRLRDANRLERVTFGWLARHAWGAAADAWAIRPLLRTLDHALTRIEAPPASPPAPQPRGIPVYLRTDLWFGLAMGGALAHSLGVIGGLRRHAPELLCLLPERLPGLPAEVASRPLAPPRRFWDFRELPHFASTIEFERQAREMIGGRPVAFVYQRYSLGNFTGALLSRRLGVPLVLEYNGPEVWIARNWGRPLRHDVLATRIERANLTAADLVVVVSDALRPWLEQMGVDPSKVLVNPNGVDPQRFSPQQEGGALRRALGWEDHPVIGFIGSFGPWHGVDVLVKAFAQVAARFPAARLLLIGDGVMMARVRALVEEHGLGDRVVLTGLVPQADGARHLAACDILVSPQVPNSDGTLFFGSPTKLFEYMAMGRAVVASRLGQLAQVLAHDATGWLVEPGSVEALAEGLAVLVADPARRARLGQAARAEVLRAYTWDRHCERILAALQPVLAPGGR